MGYYIVTDDSARTHFVTAGSWGEALGQIPGSERVRGATSSEVGKYIRGQQENASPSGQTEKAIEEKG